MYAKEAIAAEKGTTDAAMNNPYKVELTWAQLSPGYVILLTNEEEEFELLVHSQRLDKDEGSLNEARMAEKLTSAGVVNKRG